MLGEANMALVRQWVDVVWNGGDVDGLSRFHPPTFDNHGRLSAIEEARQWHLRTRSTFPDVHYTIDDMFAAGDRVALRWTATGTHSGALWHIPPTGKTITWNGMHLLRLANRQIVEVWALQNSLAQLQQMGATLHPAGDER